MIYRAARPFLSHVAVPKHNKTKAPAGSLAVMLKHIPVVLIIVGVSEPQRPLLCYALCLSESHHICFSPICRQIWATAVSNTLIMYCDVSSLYRYWNHIVICLQAEV